MTRLTLRDAVEVVLEGYTLHEGARKILETAIAAAKEKATHKPVSSRETWKCTHTWKCDNCGKSITLHEGQRYCYTKEMA